MKCKEYIYFDEDGSVDYSTRDLDRYNNNQHCVVLSFENKMDRTMVLDAMFPTNKKKEEVEDE